MDNLIPFFRSYALLTDKANLTFKGMQEEYGACIKCDRHCSDCCHAVFGLFLIESAYIKQHFDQLGNEEKKAALLRCSETDRGLKRMEKMLKEFEDDPGMQTHIMAKEKIRCPLLSNDLDCILYPYRPITCRIYGVPTKIQGKARVCGKSGFKKNDSYPVFDLDGIFRDLYILSQDLLNSLENGNPAKASLLISVSKAISTPIDELIHETFG